ncbi:MAG: histidine kinase [Bacteroidales bacterium]|nr:histidine kinase [Bacteroidales bacterium]
MFDKNQSIFKDLDHDGFSERIQTFYNKPGNVAVSIHRENTTYGQWNFRGVYGHLSIRLMTGDFDHDLLDELYLFTIENDSIFLHILEFSNDPELLRHDRFIDRVGKSLKNPDYFILEGGVTDMNGDDMDDLVFGINTGFLRQPRNVYIYDIMNDSLKKSPQSGAFITNITLQNLDKDNFKEIILSTFASSNFNKEPYPYTDTCSYLMVLDHDLNFLFPPLVFPVPTSNLQSLPIKSKSEDSFLFCKYTHASKIDHPGKFYIIENHGKIIKTKDIPVSDKLINLRLFSTVKNKSGGKIYGLMDGEGFYEIDQNLNLKRIRWKSLFGNPISIDLDLDTKEELIFLALDLKKHIIFRNNLTHPVAIDFPIQSSSPIFTVKLNGPNPPQLSVQGDQVWKLFDYGINPVWRFRFLIWAGIYLAALGFILLIRKLYSFQLKKKYETEQKITRLQLAGIKAQMEPHFIMNTINTIGSSIYRKKPEEAYGLLLNFSGMVRSLLLSSDKLTHTLEEEIGFVTNYLELEKSRFANLFTYEISIDEGVKKDIIIPKMIIQLHAENALKHGLMPKRSGGILKISVDRFPGNIVITITDNGVGRNMASKNMSESTGKGMKILGQFFDTYNKNNKNPLRQEIVDLFDLDNKPAGTMVNIHVPADFNAGIFILP